MGHKFSNAITFPQMYYSQGNVLTFNLSQSTTRRWSHWSRSQCHNICLKCQQNVRPCKCASHLRYWLWAGIVLTWTACFCDHDDVTESALTHVIQNPKAKYWVLYWHHCYDAGYWGRCRRWFLVNNGGTSISSALRNAAFCKCLYKFSDSFAHTCEFLNDF